MARMIAHDHLDEAANRTKERIQWLLDLEQNPTTLNTHYYTDYREKFLAHYKAALDDSDLAARLRAETRSPGLQSSLNVIIAKLNEIGISASAIDLLRLLPDDPNQTVLNIMASVRAYFQGRVGSITVTCIR